MQESLDDTSAFDLNNGTAFAKRYWNRTFFLDTGPIEFDEVGERKQPLIIQQFQKDGVWPVTILMLGASAQNFVDVAPVSWSVPFPPLNEPICGYLGTNVLCQKNGISLEELYFFVLRFVKRSLNATNVRCTHIVFRLEFYNHSYERGGFCPGRTHRRIRTMA